MPHFESNGASLHYEDTGDGDEVVVLSHSYLVDHRHFEPQIEALRARYRVIAYDHRGHGQSDPISGPYAMEDIYRDGIALLESLDCGPVHWVGLSTGGFVGMRIAIRRPELLRSLVLMDTSASSEPLPKRIEYEGMFLVLTTFGIRALRRPVMRSMFGTTFLHDPNRAAERDRWFEIIAASDMPSLKSFGRGIFARDDVTAQLARVETPTLVTVGEDDRATPPARARAIAATIPGARLETIPRAGHLCTREEPEAVLRILQTFLEAQHHT